MSCEPTTTYGALGQTAGGVMEGHSLALPFDSDDPEFCRGVEAGRLWEQLKQPEAFDQTIHATNVEMVVRMREATGRDMRIEDCSDPTYAYLHVEALG